MKLLIILLFLSFNVNADPYKPLPTDFIDNKKKVKKHNNSPSNKKNKNDYQEIVKNMEPILGFFDFFKSKSKVYLSIKPEQLNIEFLMGFTRQAGDGYQFDGSSMQGEGVYFLKKVGDVIQLVRKNTKFRADESRPIHKSLENHIPNSIIASTKVIGNPDEETGAILIDANKFFLYDFANVSARTGNKYNFDKENSYFNYVKSFPMNCEIDFYLHFKSKRPQDRFTLASSKSMMHRYS